MKDMNSFIVQNTFAINQLFEALSVPPSPEAPPELRFSLSSIQVLSDLYLVHHYLLMYLNKIIEFADQVSNILLRNVTFIVISNHRSYQYDAQDIF
jgi:hypothetical protein